MATVGKRSLRGVQNKKVSNKPKKKTAKKPRFFAKVVDYLKSDMYLFAHPSKYRSIKGVHVTRRDNKESEKSMLKKVCDYLMSDSYLYSPLLEAPSKLPNIQPQESELHIKRITTTEATARKSIISEDNEDLANERAFNVRLNNKERKSLVHLETMKHTFDILEKGMIKSQKRKLGRPSIVNTRGKSVGTMS